MATRLNWAMAALTLLLAAAGAHPALWFNGSQVLTVPHAPSLDVRKDLTIEAWVWPSPETSKNAFTYIVSKNMNNTGYGLLTVGREQKRLQGTGWPIGLDVAGNLVPVGKWSHLAFVRTPAQARMYVNGRLVGSTFVDGELQTNTLMLCLGSSPFSNGSEPCHWIGGLKEVRIWSVERSERQIRRGLSYRLSGREPGLAAYFRMDEGEGDLVRDRTGHTAGAFRGSNPPNWVRI